LTALSNDKGFCFASNEYFSNLYDVSKTSISKWISNLEKNGFIKIKMIYERGTKQIKQRSNLHCTPIEENFNTY
jgi:hypothetical protein